MLAVEFLLHDVYVSRLPVLLLANLRADALRGPYCCLARDHADLGRDSQYVPRCVFVRLTRVQ